MHMSLRLQETLRIRGVVEHNCGQERFEGSVDSRVGGPLKMLPGTCSPDIWGQRDLLPEQTEKKSNAGSNVVHAVV